LSNAALQRRLAAILAADVVAYSRQMAKDEPGTLARVRALRTEVIEPSAVSHGGRLFAVMGDGFLIEFASTVQAVACALAVQDQLIGQQRGLQLRIGVHAGDVVVDGDGVTGDSVNIAVRLQTLAEPGSICLSDRVREDVVGKLSLDLTDSARPH
jgi:class 3 adenylate cyclase